MKVFINLKLGTKINILVITIILTLSSIIGVVVNHQITKGIEEFALEKAKGDLNLSFRYLNSEYPGEWELKEDKLYKGSTLMNDNYEVVDTIGKDTGDTVTIFLEDTRVSTNVMSNNERAVGTKASKEVVETVLKNGEVYYGEANVAGILYQTAYMPLLDKNDNAIGMYYVGAPQSIIEKILGSFLVTFLIVLAVVVALSILAVIIFSSKIKKRLQSVSNSLELAGNGDFTAEISDNSGDELGDLSKNYNLMTMNLKKMMNEVIVASELVASSSEELTASAEQTSKATESITESIQQVASGAEHSTASVQESASSLDEVTTQVQSIAENASFITEVSSKATQKAKEGGEFVDKTVKQINSISMSVTESGVVLKSLDKRSKEIGDISGVISEIAEQTNLLALNAAIEAARAGEHGKGFAVVADEVRKLAEQSRQSSSQISKLIFDIQQDMIQSNKSIEQVTYDVKDGLDIVQQTEENFKEILTYMEKLADQINDMAATTEEVTASIQEVSSTVTEISHVSNETSMYSQNVAAAAEEQLASMEDISASSNALSNLAEELQNTVSRFKV
ncbi:methyl-accepting chemotaxis protein [Fredinandcohnia sp. QZ13]|uniref:methyl-accepting chemotaxis protein n=1 Tax=Fredinandcohnia sp. QZ13 TaxID=3073144 RepID=UPI0028530BBB|nr:methyl-accepting chemotaxis protein [Fredinandcohnia sp. QZ13]MDR4886276.1 methyl-accepting chemotaxis protein [Fredinandcohnia sp. QZ13]